MTYYAFQFITEHCEIFFETCNKSRELLIALKFLFFFLFFKHLGTSCFIELTPLSKQVFSLIFALFLLNYLYTLKCVKMYTRARSSFQLLLQSILLNRYKMSISISNQVFCVANNWVQLQEIIIKSFMCQIFNTQHAMRPAGLMYVYMYEEALSEKMNFCVSRMKSLYIAACIYEMI